MKISFIAPFFLCLCLAHFSVPASAQMTSSQDDRNVFIRQRNEFREAYGKRLEALADECEKEGLDELAAYTRKWRTPGAADKIYVAVLPQGVNESLLEEGASDAELAWEEKFKTLRKEQAEELFKLSRRAVRARHPSVGFDLLMEVLRENPDHRTARKIVGYRVYKDQWCTPLEERNLKAGMEDHPRFGWIKKSYVEKYEAGQRYVNKRWVPAKDEEVVRRRDIRQGWVVETEHYRIYTNHSLEAGVKLGRELEKFYRVWKQLFMRYFATEAQVVAAFDGKVGISSSAKHKIFFFRSREDYNRFLVSKHPNVGISLGQYSSKDRIAYFFAGKDYSPRTLFHEATHQLFEELRNTSPEVARYSNFWIIEGIATYMESLHDEGPFHVVGGFDDRRMLEARYYFVLEKYHVPFSALCAMSIEQFQGHQRLARLYSQSSGLTHFLIHYKDGIYRDALVQCLADVYSGQKNALLLPQRLKITFAELEKQYEEFITQRKDDLRFLHFEDAESE